MIKEVYAQCNIAYLEKLLEAYIKINDEQEIIYIGGRIIQSEEEQIEKATCIRIFDTFYQIFSKKRQICRDLLEFEAVERARKNDKKVKYLEGYKAVFFAEMSQLLSKLINDIRKGIRNNEHKNKELEGFLQLNLSDYKRYLCEVTLDPVMKEEMMNQTEECYKRYFQMMEEINVCPVSPAVITGHYHYSIFLFEVREKKNEAIRYLKNKRFDFLSKLDTMFKNFLESYDLLQTINTTLTNWVILTNYKEVQF